eukprot:Awhi_evm1s15622
MEFIEPYYQNTAEIQRIGKLIEELSTNEEEENTRMIDNASLSNSLTLSLLQDERQILIDEAIAKQQNYENEKFIKWWQRELQEVQDRKLCQEMNEEEELADIIQERMIGEAMVKDMETWVNENLEKTIVKYDGANQQMNTPMDLDEIFQLSTLAECVCCLEQGKVQEMPCGHRYCHPCLEIMFEDSLKDRALLIPLRCCKFNFSEDLICSLAKTREQLQKYQDFVAELKLPKVLYCSNTQCTALLKNFVLDQIEINCQDCHTSTCSSCGEAYHGGDGRQCKQNKKMDVAVQEMMTTAGWTPCSHCNRIVSLKVGCNHITCICKNEFCYRCGVVWKGCRCVLWQENNLYENAMEQLQLEDPEEIQFVGEERVQHIQEIMQNNRHAEHEHRWSRAHHCAPGTWRKAKRLCSTCYGRCQSPYYKCYSCGRHQCHHCHLRG